MKRTILYMAAAAFFIFSWTNRYTPIELDMSKPDTLTVEIKGEVASPGLYTLDWNADLNELIEAAGGTNEQADLSALSLTKILLDREVVVIPAITEQTAEKISLNSATQEQLCTLPGIGPAVSQRILDYRAETPFTSLEQIMEVKGIGEKMFAKIQDLICL